MTPFDPRLPIIAAEARVKSCHVYHCFHARREMGAQFHVTAFAAFAGLEDRHVLAILAALEAHDVLPAKRTTSSRGQRLALDWTAPQEWIDWAVRERRWSPSEAMQEVESFADYWRGRSGTGAAKLDWLATWRNWVRNSRRPNGDYVMPSQVPMADLKGQMERTAALYERMGRSVEAAEIRSRLAASDNVIQVQFGEVENPGKTAVL